MSGVIRMVNKQGTQQKVGFVYELHWPYISTGGGRRGLGTAGLNTVPSMVIVIKKNFLNNLTFF